MRRAWIAIVLAVVGCSTPLDPPTAAQPSITQRVFQPVYRASKAIQGSTAPGVTFDKFSELVQGFAVELAILKDQQLTDLDRKCFEHFTSAYEAYALSLKLWRLKLSDQRDVAPGHILLGYEALNPEFSDIAKYGLRVETPPYRDGRKRHVVSEDAVQTVWLKADEHLAKATNMYYGRITNQPGA